MAKEKTQLTWDDILHQTKFWIALFLGVSPLLTALYFAIFDKVKDNYLVVTLGLISFQVGFAINLIYALIKESKKTNESEITDIKSQYEFWKKGSKYEELVVLSINANRFIESLINQEIKVSKIRLILPNDQSVENFYKESNFVIDSNKAITNLTSSIKGVEIKLKQAQSESVISSYEIRYNGNFPLSFLAVFDNTQCLEGKYIPDRYRSDTIGLKSTSWITKNPKEVFQQRNQFEMLWNGLPTD